MEEGFTLSCKGKDSDLIATDQKLAAEFSRAVQSRNPVTGLTHDFYRYPARFSPEFSRAAIKAFTDPGDLILDPFLGAGTTAIEAVLLRRPIIGVDISSLAIFLANVKTTPLFEADIYAIQEWGENIESKLNMHTPPMRAYEWIDKGYQKNITGKNTWPIRKAIELALANIDQLKQASNRNFIRCVLLKTGQWAFDCKKKIPSVGAFRQRFLRNLNEMVSGAQEFTEAARDLRLGQKIVKPTLLQRSAIGLEDDLIFQKEGAPRLIITSPPYPGVHVLYHRWQIQGRRETPAPFWIAGCLDGQTSRYYTLGGRKQDSLDTYYEKIYSAFLSLSQVADENTLIAQLIAFSDPEWQLPRYIDVLNNVGLKEIKLPQLANSQDLRLWREVPNRKWYAHQERSIATSKEVVLFHRRR